MSNYMGKWKPVKIEIPRQYDEGFLFESYPINRFNSAIY